MALDNIKDDLHQIQLDTKAYVETSVEYYKLRGFKMVMKSTTMFLKLMLLTLTITMMLICASIAASLAIGEAVESTTLGFVIVAGIYFVLFVLILLVRPRFIEKAIIKRFSEIFYND